MFTNIVDINGNLHCSNVQNLSFMLVLRIIAQTPVRLMSTIQIQKAVAHLL